MEVGQLRQLRGDPRAAFTLLGCGSAGVPHEVVGDELSTALEHIEKRHRAVRANQRDAGVHLHHRQPPAGCRNGVALSCVSLLSDPQFVQLRLEGAPIDYLIIGAPSSSFIESVIVLSVSAWALFSLGKGNNSAFTRMR